MLLLKNVVIQQFGQVVIVNGSRSNLEHANLVSSEYNIYVKVPADFFFLHCGGLKENIS